MFRNFLLAASLMLAPTAQAQSPERAPTIRIAETAPATWSHDLQKRAVPSSFRAEVRGDFVASTSGEAEFGAVETADRSSAAFVVSLGVCGPQSAILFTRRNGTPLSVGRYRVAEGPNGADEVLAMILTGSATRPSGVFRGESGWLVVTAASGRLLAGRFQVDGVGFRAVEPEREDRRVNVTGSFSATTASSPFRVCEDAE